MNEASGIHMRHPDATRLTEFANASLRQAEILPMPEAILRGVVAMNSTVILEDRASGKRKEATVVYPIDADPAQGKLSVFSPAGRILLGLRVGAEADLPVSHRRRARMKVVGILYQPEPSGDPGLDFVQRPPPAA